MHITPMTTHYCTVRAKKASYPEGPRTRTDARMIGRAAVRACWSQTATHLPWRVVKGNGTARTEEEPRIVQKLVERCRPATRLRRREEHNPAVLRRTGCGPPIGLTRQTAQGSERGPRGDTNRSSVVPRTRAGPGWPMTSSPPRTRLAPSHRPAAHGTRPAPRQRAATEYKR